ncbi:MAG: hypothetical protein KKD46_06690 [Euryarchaeota archaeon]|nr:hypothetical protein [Euryarchaeota archaeon]MBU4221734.1 hypothetical protein [Euryarchaeota archaeon]MBU4340586.1 hypothetical protein [Euryarchaeota archaeon]MCG2737284.1 RAMP superfamily CRISPR-associated protein [Candidatus Methanoperedenaceae archaeon]
MIELNGFITALSPIHIGSGRSKGTFIKTLEHIPGRTIRGMLGYYLYKNDRQLFEATGINEEMDFSKMGIFFKNAYPVVNDGTTVASPLLFRWCKKCDTLFEKGENECKNIENNLPCLQEGAKYSGLMSFDSIKERRLKREKPPSMQIETKCPITRTGHASMPEGSDLSPYHIESISQGARFGFRILVKDEFSDRIIESLKNAGTFYGIGGFRSRGYGSVRFDLAGKQDLGGKMQKRADEISAIGKKLLVANSQMVLRNGEDSVIGFDDTFKKYAEMTLNSMGIKGKIDIVRDNARIARSIARGWSLKNQNSLSSLITCIASGSCVGISGDAQALSALEVYGVGEMTNCGYGDVYITGDVA